MSCDKSDLCCLTIGHREFLMFADKGMKVLALMKGATECTRRFETDDYVFDAEDEVCIEYRTVKACQVRLKKPAKPPAPLAIGHEPLKLPLARRTR